jgi:hypothetical protein
MAPPSKIMMIRSLARSFANFSHADGKVKTIWKNFDKTLDRGKKKNFKSPVRKFLFGKSNIKFDDVTGSTENFTKMLFLFLSFLPFVSFEIKFQIKR